MLITWKRLGYSLFCVPMLACPAADDGGATGNDSSTSDSNSTTNTNTSSTTTSSSSSATASTTASTTVDPDTGTSTMTTTPTTSGADDSTSTTTGGELCEIMLPPARECPLPAPSRRGWAPPSAPSGGADIDDYAALPDEQQGGGGFIEDPDSGGTFECDIWAQDCMEGEKCMPWANDGGGAWNATRCSPLDPNPTAVGDPCTAEGSGVSGIDDCDLGAMCWDVDAETNMGTCIELCSCAPDFPVCNTPNTACAISNDGVLVLCLPVCNPLDADACPDGQGCYGVSDSFQCAPDASGATGAVGDDCSFINGCDPGTFCAGAASVPGCDGGAAGCCSSFCSIGNDAACLDGQECAAWFSEGQAPDECLGTVGACVSQ